MYLDISENVFSLGREVVLHERLLATAIPQVQGQVTQQSHVRVFNVDGGTQPASVASDVVGENDGTHRGLARAGLAHQQNFLLHGVAVGLALLKIQDNC